MSGQKDTKTSRKNVLIVALIIGIFLVKSFVWDEYIVNSTADAALEDVKGEPGVGYVISKKQKVAIKPYKEGYKVYAVSKGFWSWSVTDELFITNEDRAFEITEEILQYKGNKRVYLTFIMDKEKSFDKITAQSPTVGAINFNRLVSDNGFLYYQYSEELFEDVTYEGIGFNGKVEKLK